MVDYYFDKAGKKQEFNNIGDVDLKDGVYLSTKFIANLMEVSVSAAKRWVKKKEVENIVEHPTTFYLINNNIIEDYKKKTPKKQTIDETIDFLSFNELSDYDFSKPVYISRSDTEKFLEISNATLNTRAKQNNISWVRKGLEKFYLIDYDALRKLRTSKAKVLSRRGNYETNFDNNLPIIGSENLENLDISEGVYISRKSLEKIVGVSYDTIHKRLKNNEIKGIRKGNKVLYLIDDDILKKLKISKKDTKNLNTVGYFRNQLNYKRLSREEEQLLSYDWLLDENRDAFNELIKKNQRLVARIASDFIKYSDHLMKEDLIQIGNEGLIDAINKFKPWLDNRFSTYAIFNIKQAIKRALTNEGRTVRLPVHLYNDSFLIKKHLDSYFKKNGDFPFNKVEYLSEKTGLNRDKIINVLPYLWEKKEISLDSTIANDTETTYHSIIPNKKANFWIDVENLDSLNFINNIVKNGDKRSGVSITNKEKFVINNLFGLLNDGDFKTLNDVAQMDEMLITPERVRQLKEKVLKKLRKISELKELYSFLD